jgi:predicted MFS family arabinose efflux permease
VSRVSPRYHVVGFGQDLSLFLAWTVIPLWAKFEGDVSVAELGLLPVPGGVSYWLGAILLGRLSDRMSRTSMVRFGLLLWATFCIASWWMQSYGWFLALAPLGGLGNALIWPSLQARMGDESTSENLERNLGAFSISWSAGKMMGFVTAGLVWSSAGLDALLGCGVLSLLLIAAMPGHRVERKAREGAPPLVDEDAPPAAVRNAHLVSAWLANLGAYGLGAIVNFLYPQLLRDMGREGGELAWILGVMFGAQTLAFWWFGRNATWKYRATPLVGWQVAGACALLVIGFGSPLLLSLPMALVMGVSLGHAYAASVYYSVHSEENRGARAGIHESLTGLAHFGIPFLGGVAAKASGWSVAPYAVAVGVVLVAIAIETRLFVGARRTASSST